MKRAFLRRPDFLNPYEGPMRTAMIPCITLFKPHYLATLEEVTK